MITAFFKFFLSLIYAFEFVSSWTRWSHKDKLVRVIKWNQLELYLIRSEDISMPHVHI